LILLFSVTSQRSKLQARHVIASGAKQSYQIFKRLLGRSAPRNDMLIENFCTKNKDLTSNNNKMHKLKGKYL